MATITRTEEMFACHIDIAPRISSWDALCCAVSNLLMPAWVTQYAAEKAEEINHQQLY